jgi:hypothetical protein
MSNTTINNLEEAIECWKAKGIVRANMEFDCGGDQMNETSWTFFDKDGNNEIDDTDLSALENFLDEYVYKKVDFYVNSDGHYVGEFGNVNVELDDETNFTFTKQATSEWNETYTEDVKVELTPEEYKFVATKVLNMNGGDMANTINYKEDTILTDEEEAVAETIGEKLDEFAREYEHQNVVGERNDWYNWTTDIDEEEQLNMTENSVILSVSTTYTEYKEE